MFVFVSLELECAVLSVIKLVLSCCFADAVDWGAFIVADVAGVLTKTL